MHGNVIPSSLRPRARAVPVADQGVGQADAIDPTSDPLPVFLTRPTAPRRAGVTPTPLRARVWSVLLPFASGYYLGYLYRTINALISSDLVAEFALTPSQLGFLTATLFLAFALIQLPLGVWLDHFGPRRVQAVLLAIAACGAALFASAHGFVALAFGRALVGLGTAGALMAGLKAITLWFPSERLALANGGFIMLGALGAVTATAPAEMMLAVMGWRGLFALLAVLTAASAVLILMVVPERAEAGQAHPTAQALTVATIYRDSRFWRLAPLSATCIGSAWALQGLWAAPWLTDVEGLTRPSVVRHLLLMATALSAGALLLGLGADHLRRRGIALRATLAAATGVALLAQLMLVVRAPLPAWLPWIIIAGIGAATVLSYAILGELFPKSASARANGALNLLHVGAACALQYGIGLIIQQWPAEAGHYAPIAYQTALGLNLVLQMAAFFWFVRPERRPMFRRFAAHPIHALAARLGLAPAAAMPYALARQVWGTRLNDAHGQARTWRCAALASLALLMLTGLSAGTTLVGGSVLIHVRQVTEVSHVREPVVHRHPASTANWSMRQGVYTCAGLSNNSPQVIEMAARAPEFVPPVSGIASWNRWTNAR